MTVLKGIRILVPSLLHDDLAILCTELNWALTELAVAQRKLARPKRVGGTRGERG